MLPLARGFVKQHTGGDGGVEAFNRAGAGNGDGPCCLCGQLSRDAVAFVADEQGDGRGQIDECCWLSLVDIRSPDYDLGFAEPVKTLFRGYGEKRKTEDAACRGTYGLGVPGADGSRERENAGGAEGLG